MTTQEQEYPLGAQPRYSVGQQLRGFSYYFGKYVEGRIVKINCHVSFDYQLDNGKSLGCGDDFHAVTEPSMREEQGVKEPG